MLIKALQHMQGKNSFKFNEFINDNAYQFCDINKK